jgi:hypothetical protein
MFLCIFAAMKVLLDINDNKAEFVLEVLHQFNFVKAKTISPAKAKFLEELSGAVEEVKQAKRGKVKLQSAKDFLNGL